VTSKKRQKGITIQLYGIYRMCFLILPGVSLLTSTDDNCKLPSDFRVYCIAHSFTTVKVGLMETQPVDVLNKERIDETR